MSYHPNVPEYHDSPSGSRWSREDLLPKLLQPALAVVVGLVVAVPAVLIVTASLTEDSRPPISTPANVDQSLLGQVPYGSR